jgi:hypothetical protein
MSYDKASPNAKIGCSNSNDPEFLEQMVREGKTNREIALILDLDYGSVASLLYRYGIKRDPNRPCKRCGGPIGSTNTRQLYCKDCQKAMDSIRARKSRAEEMRILREGLFRPAGTKVLLKAMLQGCGGIR